MFTSLRNNLGKALDKLKGKGYLTEDDINLAMREVRLALLEADVSLPVVKNFIEITKEKALGQEVVKSIDPAHMVIKIVQDNITQILGSEQSDLNISVTPPAIIMMVGLQGSGKTTSSAKLALRLTKKLHKKVLMASLDIYRPAAQEQLKILGEKNHIDTLPIVTSEKPREITKRAINEAKLGHYDVLILDTAGRLHIDQELMQELKEVESITNPNETILVVDSMTGQDAVNIATSFKNNIALTGIILTRVDGDSRGGAALSMRMITGCPIKFIGIGEKVEDFEEFHPERISQRILDKGDIVSLVEKASEIVDKEEAEAMAKKLKKGLFDFDDFASQLSKVTKMGGLGGIMNLLPGIGNIRKQLDEAGIDEKIITRQLAIISSMTKKEKAVGDKIFNASRKRRIAAGSGTTIQEVNRLLKQYRQMSDMLKKVSRMDQKSLMRGGLGQLFRQ